MQRRHFITLGTSAFLAGMGLPAQAQISDLHDAINKAGRQRMLSQRISKAWLALVHEIEMPLAQQVLNKSVAVFEQQLADLKTYAPTAEIKATYGKVDVAWQEFKAVLVSAPPKRSNAAALLQADAKLLALANQGTTQFEAALGKSGGYLVNMAGRQRMLSQRMAKFQLAAMLPVDAVTSQTELIKSRTEFATAMDVLRRAPETTPRIKEELALADGQWLFFDSALRRPSLGGDTNALKDVFVTSETLLTTMDAITGLYTGLKA